MMVRRGNIFLHQLNILQWVSVFQHIPVGTSKAGYTICRSVDLKSWEYVSDHRGEIVYNTETGDAKEITALGDYPENTTTIAPLTPYDKWDGEK